MTSSAKVLAMILAGGEGSRLHPLTRERSKPSVPFGGRYRIVDFVLSNFINSEIYSIYLLVQYKSQSLLEHARRAWSLSPMLLGHFVTVVPPQMREGPEWFQGTADAVYQNLNLIRRHRPDIVAVFGSDHIYRMDVSQMVAAHVKKRADVSVAALPVPLEQSASFGIITTDREGRIDAFDEKPSRTRPMPGATDRALASMGNYLFTCDVLEEVLEEAHERGEKDFGRDVLPRLLGSRRMMAYDFSSNRVPGVKPYEEAGYWRDVGTIGAYWRAHQDLLGAEPALDLFNPYWPIRSANYDGPAVKVVGGEIIDSTMGAGTMVCGARIERSVLRNEVIIEEDVTLEECVILDYVIIRRGCRLRNVIVDRYNIIEAGTCIGFDAETDRRHYHVDPETGVVVIPKGNRYLEHTY